MIPVLDWQQGQNDKVKAFDWVDKFRSYISFPKFYGYPLTKVKFLKKESIFLTVKIIHHF